MPKVSEPFTPTEGMVLSEIFLLREPGVPLPDTLQDLVYETLGVFRPEQRLSTIDWAAQGPFPEHQLKLLGLLCVLNGLDLLMLEPNAQECPARDFLRELGFSLFDILAINEIDNVSETMELLAAQVIQYMETGVRMPPNGYIPERV